MNVAPALAEPVPTGEPAAHGTAPVEPAPAIDTPAPVARDAVEEPRPVAGALADGATETRGTSSGKRPQRAKPVPPKREEPKQQAPANETTEWDPDSPFLPPPK